MDVDDLPEEPTASPESDRPGVTRQASKVPDDVRNAVAILTSDEAFAILITIEESGTTRFSWLFQELAIPNQEIVEHLGDFYATGLIKVTTTGKGAGSETAYTLTVLGRRLLNALKRYDMTPTPPNTGEGRKKHPDPYPNSDRKWRGPKRASDREPNPEDDPREERETDVNAHADIELKESL